ncbi:murein transglycosylase A [Acetobacteraceae bacterium H6797]|nr:murein transglycosylase A [Acetobacteraceae bacterium H6797]
MRRASGLLLLLLAACGAPPPTKVAELPGWREDAVQEALPALLAGCATIAKMPDDRALGGEGAGSRAGDWRAPCAEAAALPPGDTAAIRTFFETRFAPEVAGEGLLTGYDEPSLAGSLTPGPGYPYPLRGRPEDLVEVDIGTFLPDLKGKRLAGRVERGRLVPYADRAAIEAGAIDDRSPVILWVADEAEKFFLQIQGSGRVELPDGGVVRVGYDAQNGRRYVPIGRLLIERGEMKREDVSRDSIVAWLKANPAKAQALMNENPSYVFFRRREGLSPDLGPLGSMGVPLTPGRSLAVDRAHWPMGMPFWVEGKDPVTGAPFRRLVVAQDTGGAIRGEARGDLFWGWGPDAHQRAGLAKDQARFIALRPVARGS